jgi:hypothetical protein
MKKSYPILSKKNSKELTRFLAREGQLLLPILDLIQQAEAVVDEVIEVVGRSTIEAILLLSSRGPAPQNRPKPPTSRFSNLRNAGAQGQVHTTV